MRKYLLFLTAIFLSMALAGCSGNAGNIGTDNIPEVPLEELTNKFEKGIYQEVDPETGRVKNFATKEQWVSHMSEFMDRDLALSYADEFFYEEEGELFLLSRSGPAILQLDKPYEIKKIDDKKVQVIQTNEDTMQGKYKITITYEYRDGHWIIQNHEYNDLAGNKEMLSPKEAEEIISGKADQIINLIANKDMETLAKFIHPEKGVRFTPYSYVDVMDNVIFLPSDIKGFFSNPSKYHWGNYDGTGEPISLTPADYYDRFIFDHDYRNADQISYNEQLFAGNMINNAPEVYPESIIVEYHFEGFEEQYQGMDWRSLRLVFEEYQGQWLLVGIIHDEWTI